MIPHAYRSFRSRCMRGKLCMGAKVSEWAGAARQGNVYRSSRFRGACVIWLYCIHTDGCRWQDWAVCLLHVHASWALPIDLKLYIYLCMYICLYIYIHTCSVTHLCVTCLICMWHDLFVFGMTHLYAGSAARLLVVLCVCDMTHWHLLHGSVIRDTTRSYVAWQSFICDMTQLSSTWLIHMWHD